MSLDIPRKRKLANMWLIQALQRIEEDLELSELDSLATLADILNRRCKDLLKSERSGTSTGDDL